MNRDRQLGVWFPTVRTGTGTDVFTERLAAGLADHGIRTEITWLPLRAEFAPWTVPMPEPPEWASIVHVNTWLHPRFLPKHLPVVATIHHSVHHPDIQSYKDPVRAAYHRLWFAPNERRLIRGADIVIAVSCFVADTARKTLLDAPMQVIYNGIDTQRFQPGTRKRHRGEPFRLLYVGSWKILKGVDLLAPIMRELGDGFELRYTGGKAVIASEKEQMPPNMHDLGRLVADDTVVAAMQDSDALLFPSRSEGFGLVALEAMACGLPVIATRGSSLVEVAEDGVTGFLCPQDDVAAFVASAEQLARDVELWTHMAHAANERACRYFSLDQMVNSYLGVYAEQFIPSLIASP